MHATNPFFYKKMINKSHTFGKPNNDQYQTNMTNHFNPDTFSHIMEHIDDLKDVTSLIFVCKHINNLMQYFKSIEVKSMDDFDDKEYVKYVTFRHNFHQPLNNLPNRVTHITFGQCFNRSLANLPNNIAITTFGDHCNQPLTNLPNSITKNTFLY